ncbi:MAG: hypothetical protein ACK5X0_05090 [Rhodospirillales bacterium]
MNNTFDVDFYKKFVTDPSSAAEIWANQYFESIGHSYWMAYGHLMAMLSSTFDENFEFLPDARIWDSEFPKLKKARHVGFFHGSPIVRVPVGLREIFEGQARFSQLQYLAFGTGNNLTWATLRAHGYLSGVYVNAFEEFLGAVYEVA